ncbi:MAG: hypothetical protein E7215_11825 [Clostridium sulfidigenes]|uniref:Spore coat protein n=1 Tax=Clostridium sulfidigenes TaxID=318464 RepID=A0A927W9N5_9CLOT|nr:hypothetical protein [Clostridium sulfidigenes]HAR84779.1 hypothetical protein [Clostridium sp.]
MNRFFYDSFQQYLCTKGVKKVNFMLKSNETLSRRILEEKVINQINIISEVHKLSCGFNGYLRKRINNHTCKLIEDDKIQLKKFRRSLEKIKENGPIDRVEEIVLERGDRVLARGEKVIDTIMNNDYMELVARSMDNVEICLTNVDFDNLGKSETIEIVNFDDIAYNMVEMDCYYFLVKLKRKGFKVDFNKCIDEFCKLEGLGESSKVFIRALLSYPYEFIKIYEKYKKNKKSWNEEEYIRRLLNGIKEDEMSLI